MSMSVVTRTKREDVFLVSAFTSISALKIFIENHYFTMKMWQHNKFILCICNQMTAVKTLRELRAWLLQLQINITCCTNLSTVL